MGQSFYYVYVSLMVDVHSCFLFLFIGFLEKKADDGKTVA
jgi:hypothetical protein